MIKYFESLADAASACTSEVEARVRIISGTRLLLQQAVYALLEWVALRRPDPESQPNQQVLQALKSPADGSLVDGLEELVIAAEQLGWTGVSRILIERLSNDRPAARLCRDGGRTLMGLLRSLVALRNDGAEGHGLIGGYDPEAEVDSLRALLALMAPIIPRPESDQSDSRLVLGSDRLLTQLGFIRLWDGLPALVRRIKVLAADRVRVYAQSVPLAGVRSEFNFDAPNPFQHLAGRTMQSPIVWTNKWEPLCYVPDRTTDSFTGRVEQIEALADWFSDEGARACLIFGDGGLGKTTLALEFVHRVLDEELEVTWRPKLVVFYTAKRWQWGLDGLQPIAAGRPHLRELIAHLHVLLFGCHPSADFYRMDLVQAASFMQGKIKKDVGLERSEILLIIDNAETLIETDTDRAALGRELREVTRRLGRVMLTSRRRELVEATPVSVGDLSETEALEFLRDRQAKLGLKQLEGLTDKQILVEIERLERRPIVIDALANALSDPAVRRLEQAADRIRAMLQKDLGEFLFADAWGRLKPEVRRLLLLMTRIADVHDAQSLKICANAAGVSVQEAEQALDESGGIASVVSVQGAPQITFSKNFIEFAKDRTVPLPHGGRSPTDAEITAAQSAYSAFIQSAQKFTGDRIAQAFRTPQAKAAHRARQEGRIDESQRLYEAAVLTDSTNGWLLDRYAYFLFHDVRDYRPALHHAKRAVELLPTEGEPWYTRGLIEARLGEVRACELSLKKAEALGIEWPRCAIQRCWAYLKARPRQLALAEKELGRLEVAVTGNSKYGRHRVEVERLKTRFSTLSSRRTASAR